MRIVYNLDPNPDPEDNSSRVECPICGQGAQMDSNTEFECSTCRSELSVNAAFEVNVLKNSLRFSKKNVIGAIALLFVVAGITIILYLSNGDMLILGFMLLIWPVVVILPFNSSGVGTGLQQLVDVYLALKDKRLMRYDLGSKILAYSIGGIMVFGLILMILEIIGYATPLNPV